MRRAGKRSIRRCSICRVLARYPRFSHSRRSLVAYFRQVGMGKCDRSLRCHRKKSPAPVGDFSFREDSRFRLPWIPRRFFAPAFSAVRVSRACAVFVREVQGGGFVSARSITLDFGKVPASTSLPETIFILYNVYFETACRSRLSLGHRLPICVREEHDDSVLERILLQRIAAGRCVFERDVRTECPCFQDDACEGEDKSTLRSHDVGQDLPCLSVCESREVVLRCPVGRCVPSAFPARALRG